jgi:hypothetical protein
MKKLFNKRIVAMAKKAIGKHPELGNIYRNYYANDIRFSYGDNIYRYDESAEYPLGYISKLRGDKYLFYRVAVNSGEGWMEV